MHNQEAEGNECVCLATALSFVQDFVKHSRPQSLVARGSLGPVSPNWHLISTQTPNGCSRSLWVREKVSVTSQSTTSLRTDTTEHKRSPTGAQSQRLVSSTIKVSLPTLINRIKIILHSFQILSGWQHSPLLHHGTFLGLWVYSEGFKYFPEVRHQYCGGGLCRLWFFLD